MGAIVPLHLRGCRHGKPLANCDCALRRREEGEWIELLRRLDPVNRQLMIELTRSLYGNARE